MFETDAYARPGHSYDNSTLKKRIEELAYAIDQIRELPWVDQDRIVLMGFSERGPRSEVMERAGLRCTHHSDLAVGRTRWCSSVGLGWGPEGIHEP